MQFIDTILSSIAPALMPVPHIFGFLAMQVAEGRRFRGLRIAGALTLTWIGIGVGAIATGSCLGLSSFEGLGAVISLVVAYVGVMGGALLQWVIPQTRELWSSRRYDRFA